MDILHLMQWDGICHVLFLLYLFPIYHMDVRNIVCQDITYLYMYSNLTSYWTMMANNGYYLYMLNKYEIFIYWTKTNSIRLVYQMENTVWTIITLERT